jgi:hypothetical protein
MVGPKNTSFIAAESSTLFMVEVGIASGIFSKKLPLVLTMKEVLG